jgi:protein-S-isoprenylcysteine O-methyltransferase Ste14
MVFFSYRRYTTPGARLNAAILFVMVSALGAIIRSLLRHGWGDEETASGAAVRPVWTVVGGACVIAAGLAVLLIRWRRDQEDR